MAKDENLIILLKVLLPEVMASHSAYKRPSVKYWDVIKMLEKLGISLDHKHKVQY